MATATRVSDADLSKPSEFRCLADPDAISAVVITEHIARAEAVVKGLPTHASTQFTFVKMPLTIFKISAFPIC